MNFLGIDKNFSGYKSASTVILPIPYEATTSYMSGTQKGPEAVIEASAYVELYDEELDTEAYRSGVFTAAGPEFSGKTEQDFDKITKTAAVFLNDNKFLVSIGGEHSISFPLYRAFHQRFGDLSVLQLDAHSDLRYDYEDSIYSHASVMRRIYELNRNIVQVGIRSQCAEEAQFIKQEHIKTFYAHHLRETGFGTEVIDALSANVYITFDVDFLDPSIMPSTGTPEPGGFLWDETLRFLRLVFAERNVVGFDVVELSPLPGLAHADFLTAKLIYKLIGMKQAALAGHKGLKDEKS